MDDAIIATGFGQYLLEGKIDKDILELSKIALKRQLIPDIALNAYMFAPAEPIKLRLHLMQKKLDEISIN